MNDPREHVNEEPRNDLLDVGIGFAGMFGLMLLIAVVATVIQLVTR
ncbi:YqzM family protein [Paenibacillus alkalitolerans]|nr:YqzM family protein [Paenibacillus alkalitolerans]